MGIRLHFWGAARTVTGSSHHLECAGRQILLDCGLFQGKRQEAQEINKHLALKPEELAAANSALSAVVLSHAHIDHSGNLPGLIKQGYRGPIYTTPTTIDLCDPMLKDSAHIQEGDAEFMNRRRSRRKMVGVAPGAEPFEPLYTQDDAEQVLRQMRPVKLHESSILNGSTKDEGFSISLTNAGHMLGSACVLVEANERGQKTRLLFSGDVGRKNLPIIQDPDEAPAADYLIMESTYGNRLHQPPGPVKQKLAALVKRVAARGGRIIVPAFAVERTQQLVMLLHELTNEKQIPDMPIFVDSPLATKVTDVFRKHTEDWDQEICDFYHQGHDPFDWERLKYTQTVQESKALNDLRVPFIVMAASGMCEAGRILHHLKNGIEDPRNLVLITGYQAANTLGRKIVERLPEVNIFGEPMRLRAEVDSIGELSGHADQNELLAWMEPTVKTVKKVFLVHGEPLAQQALKEEIERRYKLEVICPARGDRFEVS
ncbi:MBL fold metallo-hydrolase RNA specificity domain-containing protein [Edaphobacter albus]|uniref:MBL fold metallo-hydrolase RNA specificity domain-containing protein n=1 Tax=Edaphobacter sp. 4G125 TaxID=2763071 RepID=UPI0016441E43|nr:MBL fold metallo-hydrolase [Edaphobacter sp. 4G125]QNI35956.1 MBL fold metallo-hydrolase [Edaphobacter sp. 4G125]